MGRSSVAVQRREQVLAAFARCVARSGIAGTSLEDVAAEAGLARGHARHYLGNRHDQVVALCEWVNTADQQDFAKIHSATDDRARVDAVMHYLFDPSFYQPSDDLSVFLALFEEARRDEALRKMFLDGYQDILETTAVHALTENRPALTPTAARDIAYLLLSAAVGNAHLAQVGISVTPNAPARHHVSPRARSPVGGLMSTIVFRNGPVFRADAARSFARGIAVRDGRIVAVGGDVQLAPFMRDAADVVDLEGRLLLPGFVDAHVHPVFGGVERLRCDLTGVTTADEYQRLVSDYAVGQPTRPWIQGGGWSMEAFSGGLPTRQLLDSVVTDRPVFLPNRDHHSAWVNTRALELAGIDAQTSDPADGASSVTPTATRPARCTKARRIWSDGSFLRTPLKTSRPACGKRSATCTRWASSVGRMRWSASTVRVRRRTRRT